MKMKKTLSIILVALLVSLQPAFVAAVDTITQIKVDENVIQVENAMEVVSIEEVNRVGTVKLTSGNLNVRKGPSIEDEIIGKLPNKTKVDVIEQFSEWAAISYDGLLGYVSLQYLTIEHTDKDTSEKPNPNVAKKKIIVLDPGHGGKDPGAIAKNGTYESKLVWNYSMEMKKSLEQSGYVVHLTRTEKNSCIPYKKINDELDCRATFAQKVKGDIFISIHADANPNAKFRGTVTFYNDRNDLDGNINPFSKESKLLAQYIQTSILPAIGSTDRGIANKNYYVNRMNSVPSVLVELGVMTNDADFKILTNTKTQEKVSKALVKAVDQYFGF